MKLFKKRRRKSLSDVIRKNMARDDHKAPALDLRKHLYPIRHSSQN